MSAKDRLPIRALRCRGVRPDSRGLEELLDAQGLLMIKRGLAWENSRQGEGRTFGILYAVECR